MLDHENYDHNITSESWQQTLHFGANLGKLWPDCLTRFSNLSKGRQAFGRSSVAAVSHSTSYACCTHFYSVSLAQNACKRTMHGMKVWFSKVHVWLLARKLTPPHDWACVHNESNRGGKKSNSKMILHPMAPVTMLHTLTRRLSKKDQDLVIDVEHGIHQCSI